MPEETKQPTPQAFSAVVFCPLCCTAIDVDKAGHLELDCVTCETKFTLELDPEAMAAHAIN